jgi:hypothetical protein
MEKQTKERFKIVGLFLVVIAICIIAGKCHKTKIVEPVKPIVTKHIEVKSIPKDSVKVEAVPHVVKTQKKKDKKRRKDIITKIDSLPVMETAVIQKDKATITTIDSSGTVKQAVHDIKPTDKVTVDATGKLEIEHDYEAEQAELEANKRAIKRFKRVRFFKRVLNAVELIAAVWLGTKL